MSAHQFRTSVWCPPSISTCRSTPSSVRTVREPGGGGPVGAGVSAVASAAAGWAFRRLAVVQGWLNSPGHCANMMSPGFTEMGVAFVVDRKSEAGIYWTQVLATPQ